MHDPKTQPFPLCSAGNFWTARKNVVAAWQAEFAPPVGVSYLERLLCLARAIVMAGERESVYRVLETCAPQSFRAAPGWNYADYLQQRLAITSSFR